MCTYMCVGMYVHVCVYVIIREYQIWSLLEHLLLYTKLSYTK